MVRKLVYLLFVLLMMTASAQAVMTHQYTFTGTTADSVDAAPGTLMGGATVAGGDLVLAAEGDYLDLPGGTIAINTYEAVTLEMWATQPTTDQGWTMGAAFGDTVDGWQGVQYLAMATSRQDNVSRSMLTDDGSSEVGVIGPELLDGVMHHYVLTIGPLDCCFGDQDVITLYIDGQLYGAQTLMGRSLANVSNTFAYIGKSVWGDPTWIANVDEFRIYDNALGCDDVMQSYLAGPEIPEPATMVLLGLGSLALLRRRK